MGINYVYGITPLDHGINADELLAFAKGNHVGSHCKLMTTRDAYIAKGREINKFDAGKSEFSENPKQLEYIKDFVDERKRPMLYDPATGEKKVKQNLEMTSHHSKRPMCM